MEPQEDGTRYRARIVRALEDKEHELEINPDRTKFLCTMNNEAFEDVMSYNEIMEHINKDQEDPTVWKFRKITAHEGPLDKNHPNWAESSYNVMIEWEDGSITTEPLTIIAADDPVTCAIYARDNQLLDLPGWKRFKAIAKRQKKLFRMANQAKLRSFRTSPKFQYSFEVPRNYKHATEIDERNDHDK